MKPAPTSTIRIIALLCICVILTTILAGCASDQDALTASATIPDGWEVVSTDGNLTHLRLKEGSDAYHWVDRYGWQLRDTNANLPLDVQIVGNEAKKPISPDKDGNVYFIVYYGRFYAEEIDGKFQLVDAPEEDLQSPMTLHMESGGEDWIGNLSGTSLFPEPWSLDEFVEYNDVLFEPLEKVNPYDPEARVGLKRAVLIACPFNKLDTGWKTLIFRTQQRDGSSGDYSEEDSLSYATHNNVVYFEKEDLAETEFTLLTDVRIYSIVTLAFLLCSFVIMLISTILNKSRFIHAIPLLFGWLHSFVVFTYCKMIPFPEDVLFPIVVLLAYFTQFVYPIVGILLLIIRWIIDSIRRRIAKKKALRRNSVPDDSE